MAGRWRVWSAEDDAFLRDARANDMTIEAVAETLGRTAAAVASRACRNGLTWHNPDRSRPWTPADDAALAAGLTNGLRYRALARQLGRTPPGVWFRAKKLGLTVAGREARALCSPKRERREPKVERSCLHCRKMFPSYGPGNRMCSPCLEWAAAQMPGEPAHIAMGART